ncbi:hypothetical protein DFH09DRAFT_1365618 [Mycena vulgaris]|nr:hypothetical protein DFH09DRAFT_1365618 [Mycena vulgaris]
MQRVPYIGDFSQLPPSLRKIASQAANGSLSALQEVLDVLMQGSCSHPDIFIPALLRNLDVSRIPDPDRMDRMDPILDISQPTPSSQPIVMALTSLDCLTNFPHIPREHCSLLWPSAWRWMQFAHTYHGWFPNGPAERDFCITFLLVLGRFQAVPDFSRRIGCTPGVHFLIGRAWTLLLDDDDGPLFSQVFLELCIFLRRQVDNAKDPAISTRNPDALEELVEGVGSPSAVRSVIFRHIERFLGAELSPLSIYALGTAAVVLAELIEPIALSFAGAVTAITNMICFLSRVSDEELVPRVTEALLHAFLVLSVEFTKPKSYFVTREALRAGLLRGIIACARLEDSSVQEIATQILGAFLCPSSSYYALLPDMADSMQEIRDTAETVRFKIPRLSDEWHIVADVVEGRLAVKRHYDSEDYVSLKACDSIECGKIQKKRELLRCSSCQAHYYCGAECQGIDWRDGHREACGHLRRLQLSAPDDLRKRKRSFVRAMLHADYIAYKAAILRAQVEFMLAHPGESCYVAFKYYNNFEFRVCPARELDPRWAYLVDRAVRSEGRIELHMVAAWEDVDEDPPHWFPLQSDAGAMQAGLRRIAADLEDATSLEMDEAVAALITATQDVVQIH